MCMNKPLFFIKFALTLVIAALFLSCAAASRWDDTKESTRSTAREDRIATPANTTEADKPKKVASLRGTIRTANGEPIKNARVAISGGNYPAPVFVFTDEAGAYIFENVPTGTWYVITVRAENYRFRKPSEIVAITTDSSGVDYAAEPNQ